MIHIGSAHVTRNIAQNKCKCEKGPGTQQVPLNRYSHVHPIPLYHGTGGTVHGTGTWTGYRIVGQTWSVRVGCPVDVELDR